jgi:hypothetical protein
MAHKETYEPEYEIKSLTTKGEIRYLNIHSQESQLRKTTSKYRTHYRQGKAYYNYFIRLPKAWADGLELESHDSFRWTIVSYDPVVLQLRKLDKEDSA